MRRWPCSRVRDDDGRARVVAACLVAGIAVLYCGAEKRATPQSIEPARAPIVAPEVLRAELEAVQAPEPGAEKQHETPPDDTRVRASLVATLHGVVRWPDGTPAGGASVSVNTVDAEMFGLPSLSAEVACDRNTGEFTVVDMRGACIVSASARDERGATTKLERRNASLWTTGPVRVEDPSQHVELVLAAGITLSGEVRDDTGSAVARFSLAARRCAVRADGTRDTPLFQRGVSATFRKAAGRYSWSDLGPGTWVIVASASGYARSSVQAIELGQTPVELDFVVQRPAEISGTLVDADGKPCAEHWVGVVYADEELWIAADAQCASSSDAEGNFRIEQVKPGKLRVRTDSSRADKARPEDWFELAPAETRAGLKLVATPR